eukprot:gene30527-35556_t
MASQELKRNVSVKKPSVFVSNLPFEISEAVVRDAFWEIAEIDPEHVELLKKSLFGGRTKTCGLGVVTLHSEEEVKKAMEKLDGQLVLGRPMIIRLNKFESDDPNYIHVDASAAVK